MPIVLKDTGSNSIPVPDGTHLALCFRIVDLGVQPDSGYGEKHQICLSWELPNELVKTDQGMKPMGVSKIFNLSFAPKSRLREELVRWRGREFTADEIKGFELSKVLGKPCQLAVVHKTNSSGQTKSKVDSIFAVPKGLPIPAMVNPPVEYSLEQGKDATYNALPGWIRKMVDNGLAHLAQQQAEPPADEPPQTEAPEEGDPVPF